jgi:SSS family solute:Na+ symporter
MQTIIAKPELLYFVFVYFAFMLGMGAYYSRKIKSSDDYALAGRQLGPIVLMGTLMATSVGSGTVTGGGNSLAYNFGPWAGVFWVIPYFVFCIGYLLIYKRIRKNGAYTVPQLLKIAYGRNALIVGGIINLIGLAGIVSYQYRGLAYVLNVTTGLNIEAATIISVAVITAIAMFGGLFSVAYTDAFGAFVIVICCLVGVPYALKAGGGWEHILSTVAASKPEMLTLSGGRTFLAIVGSLMPLICLEIGDQNFYQRLAAGKDDFSSKVGIWGWLILVCFAIPSVAVISFTAYTMFGNNITAGMAFMSMTTVVPLVVGGMLLAAASAFIITTGTSYLLTSATSITYDFYKEFMNDKPNDKMLLNITRYSTPALGVIAFIILQFFPTILAVQNWSYTMIGAGVTPALLGCLLSKKVTPLGGLLSIIVGAGLTLAWEIFKQPFGITTIIVSFPAAVLVLILVSAMTQNSIADRKEMIQF